MNNTLLASIDKKAINTFRKDLLQMLRIGKEMDRYYAESNQDVDIYMKKFNSLVESFNKKYKNIKLKMIKKTNEVDLKILLNEKSVRDCFENAASKIIGVQAIGTSNFGTAIVSDAEAFSNQLEKTKSKLYITYYSPQTGTTNVFLQYDKKEKKVELVYDIKEIENEPSPEFQLAAYYALNQPYNKKINLHDEGATLGFSSLLSHVEKAEYFRKFDPPFTE
ncbi:MAG: hypothetical protein QF568_01985 [Flavobacteriales bacterium]|jgi:hypothetical protein|nr:hypothetical protein [Flavobacteriales bacterium]|tara:strand:- start:2670 stop:3332 length:663 start_codon:yes stop_codon:yes gene_type:complete